MSQRSLEIEAQSVDEAVQQGLRRLGVSAAQVIVEVLQEPSAGIFGVGARPARVLISRLADEPAASEEPAAAPAIEAPADETLPDDHYYTETAEAAEEIDDLYDEDDYESDDAADDDAALAADEGEPADEEFAPAAAEGIDQSEWDDELRTARNILGELLQRMELNATIRIGRAGEEEDAPWLLSLEGAEAERLVGRRGEALTALQYLLRQMVSRRLGQRCDFVIDADGYKARRSEKLSQLAKRMANQAVQQGRTLTLEPMPPNERRVIHLTLRCRKDVATVSVGEGDGRKVTIAPR